ncbi:MAG: dicarboxylate--CoA ligase PimA [Alphaproteobacteria bacterium]|nr:dicarboxylate--CoA ligase PimA [Alphaproteobacteria bacterium]HCQ71726.1 dicarboxylate--CoA ligase PimA [Rhodospirillaceae bacterium]
MVRETQFSWEKQYDSGISWGADLMQIPVEVMLQRTVEKFPDRPAFDFLGARLTWSQIGFGVDQLANGLQAKGLGKGDRVGLLLPNCPYYLQAYYAILKTGATAVNLNPLYSVEELEHLIEDSELTRIITLDLAMMFDKVQPMLASTCLEEIIVCPFAHALPFPKRQLFCWLKGKEIANVHYTRRIIALEDVISAGQAHAWQDVDIDPVNDIALFQYTGGTTGLPKAAMLTHENIVANAQQCKLWFREIREGQQRMLAVLPFFHVFSMTVIMNLSVLCGLEIIALPRFDLEQTLKAIDKKKPHLFPAVPAIYSAINASPKARKYNLSSLLYCIAGGAPLPQEVKKAFEAKTGCTLIEGYGLTESSPVVCANPLQGENVDGSIGLPFPQTIVEIVNPENHDEIMPTGERGELCIRGPQVMKGYWNKPDATRETLQNGRLHTGDIAIMDERGYVFIVDRIKDMIITNGYNVYPRNIEEAIYKHPAVHECIVAGLPDKQRGEIVKAWVKLKDGRSLSAEDLKAFLKDKLSPMEVPRRYEFRDEDLPKTLIGKLSRKDIVAQELEKKS